MPDLSKEIQELRRQVVLLTQRVYRLEQAAGAAAEPEAAAAVGPPAAVATTGVPPARMEPLPPAAAPPRRAPQPDLESKIGSHLLNRIGIVAVLIGVAYFLKLAFENNWIGPAGRIAIGLLAGIGVILWSERFRVRGYGLFSLSLKAVGVGTLYLSLWAAFQLYRLVPGPIAFLAMVAVTASTAVLALRQNARALAVFALLGGFATPLLLSTGENRQAALFSYVILLDLATLALTALRPWRNLLVLSFAGTQVLYIGWYASFYTRPQLESTLAFLTVFFVAFAVAPLVRYRGDGRPAAASRTLVLLPLLNGAFYFFEVYDILDAVNTPATAWVAVALAGAYLALSLRLPPAETPNRLLYLMHVGLAVGFLTIAIPIQLDAHWITIGWFVEAAVLLWVATRADSDFLRLLSVAALALGVARLLFVDNFYTTHLLFNERAATFAVAIAVLALIAYYAGRERQLLNVPGAALAVIAINLLALVALSYEVRDVFLRAQVAAGRGAWHSLYVARDFTYSALWMAYGAALMAIGFSRRSAFLRWQALVLIAFTIVKVFLYDVAELERGYRVLSLLILGLLLLGISFAYQRDWLKLSARPPDEA